VVWLAGLVAGGQARLAAWAEVWLGGEWLVGLLFGRWSDRVSWLAGWLGWLEGLR